MDKYRDQDGFILLNYSIVGKQGESDLSGFSFEFDDLEHARTRYFYKKNNPLFVYNEMVGSELGKDFGLNVVDYDIARYFDSVGNISKNFHKATMLYLETLLTNYYGNAVEKCNLNNVLMMFKDRYHTDIVTRLENQLIDLLMFDMIIDNHDRHARNITIDMKTKTLGPIFDNELMLTRAVYNNKFHFSLFEGDEDTIDAFFTYMDEETIKKFVDKVEIINKGNMLKVVERIEKRIGTQMDGVAKNLLLKKFELQYAFLQDKIKEYNNRRRLTLGLGDSNV